MFAVLLSILVFDLLFISFRIAICWESVVPLAVHLCCFYCSAVLVVRVPFPFGVWGRVWNSILSVPDHCLFIYFEQFYKLWLEVRMPKKSNPASIMG